MRVYFMFKFIFKVHRNFHLFLKMVLHWNRWPTLLGRLPSSRTSGSCSSAYLGEENVIKQQLSFRLIFGDIGVGVHPKDFWGRVQRQSLCVFDVALVLRRWIPESQEVKNQLSCRTFSLRRENFQYSSYWVDEPVELDTKCFHFLSTWSKVKKKKETFRKKKIKCPIQLEWILKWREAYPGHLI